MDAERETQQVSHIRDFLHLCETDEERRAILRMFLDDLHYSDQTIYRAMKSEGLTLNLLGRRTPPEELTKTLPG